jgi:hypothetical protein
MDRTHLAQDNIKLDLKAIGRKGMDWINLAQDNIKLDLKEKGRGQD